MATIRIVSIDRIPGKLPQGLKPFDLLKAFIQHG
jgi:hypothetical protein